MFSTKSSKTYYERMKWNNTMVIDEDNSNSNISPELSYETSQEKTLCLSMAAENQLNTRLTRGISTPNTCLQHSSGQNSNTTPIQGVIAQNEKSAFINIPLLYDSNVPIDPEIWNGGFHPTSLHSLIKHIASDTKNIKDSLKFMAKYILNKQVKPTKTNDLDDFNGIGDAVWNFISFIYDANQDALFTDNKSTTLRKEITAKFTPRIQLIP